MARIIGVDLPREKRIEAVTGSFKVRSKEPSGWLVIFWDSCQVRSLTLPEASSSKRRTTSWALPPAMPKAVRGKGADS